MKGRIPILALIAYLALLTFRCDEPLITEGNAFHFPLDDGNYWSYLSNNPVDYPEYTITCGPKTQYSSDFTAWPLTKQYRFTTEYLYWGLTDTYLRDYSSIQTRTYCEYISFPIEVGKSWPSGGDGYTVTCYGKETVATPDSEFTDCYKIGYETDDGTFECYWYKPDIGFVKIGRGDAIGDITEFVYLNDYYVKE